MTAFDLAGASTRMSRFISAMINERSARSYTHLLSAMSDIIAIEEAEEGATMRDWLVADLADSIDDQIDVEERFIDLLGRTQAEFEEVKRRTPDLDENSGAPEMRHADFSAWVAEDPVGATLFVADMLDRASEAATIDSPNSQDSPANRSLRKAASAAIRLAEELAEATGEPFERAKVEAEQWRTELSLAPVEPLGLYETAVETMFPERANTRRWLENLPLAQISALAEGTFKARSGTAVGGGLDTATARRVWPLVRVLNGHVVTAAAEALKADPRPEFPVASLERMRTSHGPPELGSTAYVSASELSPSAYVDLIEREVSRTTRVRTSETGGRIVLDRRPLSNSILMPPSQAGDRARDRLGTRPPGPPPGIPGLPSPPPPWGGQGPLPLPPPPPPPPRPRGPRG